MLLLLPTRASPATHQPFEPLFLGRRAKDSEGANLSSNSKSSGRRISAVGVPAAGHSLPVSCTLSPSEAPQTFSRQHRAVVARSSSLKGAAAQKRDTDLTVRPRMLLWQLLAAKISDDLDVWPRNIFGLQPPCFEGIPSSMPCLCRSFFQVTSNSDVGDLDELLSFLPFGTAVSACHQSKCFLHASYRPRGKFTMSSSSRLFQPLFQPASRKKIGEINDPVKDSWRGVVASPLLHAQSIIRTRVGQQATVGS